MSRDIRNLSDYARAARAERSLYLAELIAGAIVAAADSARFTARRFAAVFATKPASAPRTAVAAR